MINFRLKNIVVRTELDLLRCVNTKFEEVKSIRHVYLFTLMCTHTGSNERLFKIKKCEINISINH